MNEADIINMCELRISERRFFIQINRTEIQERILRIFSFFDLKKRSLNLSQQEKKQGNNYQT